jgi:hypothetical protein
MVFSELFKWWYGYGWKHVLDNGYLRMMKVSHMFSVPILLRTLMSPWRRIITYPGASLQDKMHAFGDNLVSRMVGFTVRAMVLLAAGVMLLCTALVSAFMAAVWPLIPPAILGFIVLAIIS